MDYRCADGWAEDEWIAASDLALYLRCRHAWWALDRGRIGSGEAGVAELLAALPTAKAEDGALEMENPELGIRGRLAAVEYDGGALWPVQARDRDCVRRDDRLALAFDWLLLEPARTRSVQPTGVLRLQRGGEPVEVEVKLGEGDFHHLEVLLGRMREARRAELRRRPCACPVCAAARRGGRSVQPDLTRLFDLGKARAAALAEVGITDCAVLESLDAEVVADALQGQGIGVSSAQVEQMRLHARSYREQRPILFAEPPDPGERFIALDLEYDALQPRLWLIGACAVDPDRCRSLFLWSDDEEEERFALERLASAVASMPGVPVLTWAGTSADLPQLLGACRRLGLDGLLDDLEERHVDLYAAARQCLRLPIPDLSLGGIASYFGISKASPIANGREAQALYNRYQRRHSIRVRERIREELIAYNRDDLESLVECLREIRALPVERAAVLAC